MEHNTKKKHPQRNSELISVTEHISQQIIYVTIWICINITTAFKSNVIAAIAQSSFRKNA